MYAVSILIVIVCLPPQGEFVLKVEPPQGWMFRKYLYNYNNLYHGSHTNQRYCMQCITWKTMYTVWFVVYG